MKYDVKPTGGIDFAALGADARKAVEASLHEAVDIVVAEARQLAAPMRKSGVLEASIGGEVKNGRATVYARKFYARLVEYGSRHARAHPFMRPALVQSRARIAELMKRALDSAVAGTAVDVAPRDTPDVPVAAEPAPPVATRQYANRPQTRGEWQAYGHAKKHGLLHRNDPARIGK